MKALRVICIVVLIISLLITGLLAIFQSAMGKEADSIKDLSSTASETEILKSKVSTNDKGERVITIGSGSSAEEYTVSKYESTMKDLSKVMGTGTLIFGVIDVLCVAGIVGSSISISKRKKEE